MKSEKEIKDTLTKLDHVAHFINNYGNHEECGHERVEYANAVCDVVSWILDDRITSDDFLSEDYADISSLKRIAKKIEARTDKKLEDYKFLSENYVDLKEIRRIAKKIDENEF